LSGNPGHIRKILEIEEKKGFPDTTVIGGVDKYLKNWLSQITACQYKSAELLQIEKICAPNPGYANLTPIQRKMWAKQLLNWLDRHESYLNNCPDSSKIVEKTIINERSNTPPIKILKTPLKTNKPVINQSLDSPITAIKGINEVLQKRFTKLELRTVRDLLYFFPSRHLDYSKRTYINNLTVGQENTILANIWEAREVNFGSRRSAEATVGDETGNVRIVWFNQPYLARSLKTGTKIVISGRVTLFGGMPVFESPEWEPYDEKDLVHTGRLVPVYPLTQGLSQRQVRRILKPAIDQWVMQLDEFLPDDLMKRLKLLNRQTAIRQAHYPADEAAKDAARRRLAFDELFLLQLGVLNKKRNWQESQTGLPINTDRPELKHQQSPTDVTAFTRRSRQRQDRSGYGCSNLGGRRWLSRGHDGPHRDPG